MAELKVWWEVRKTRPPVFDCLEELLLVRTEEETTQTTSSNEEEDEVLKLDDALKNDDKEEEEAEAEGTYLDYSTVEAFALDQTKHI